MGVQNKSIKTNHAGMRHSRGGGNPFLYDSFIIQYLSNPNLLNLHVWSSIINIHFMDSAIKSRNDMSLCNNENLPSPLDEVFSNSL